MSAPEQIPYVGYVANGIATDFPITFDLHDVGYLIVTLNKEIPQSSTYTVDLNGMKVVFAQAPKDGDQVELYRDTVIDRETDYRTYDNSFRPEAVNYDFDKIIHILQEQQMIDAELASRLKQEIEWRRTHDANFDELAKMRDAQVFSGLKGYIDTIFSTTNPNIFDGVTAGIVFANDKKSVQTHLEIIYQQLADNRQSVINEKDRALAAEQAISDNLTQEVNRAKAAEDGLLAQINSIGGGSGKAYKTYAAMVADKANIAINSIVSVTNDPDVSKNGNYQYDGTNFTKSAYDPAKVAEEFTKNYVSTNALALKPNLVDENLNNVTSMGLYRQSDNTKATIANNYPTGTNGAGILEVINNSGLIIQEYTTWYNLKFRRTKYGTFDFLPWQEALKDADVALVYRPNLASESINNVLTSGVYRQLSDTDASLVNGYPTDVNGAGILEVINKDNLVIQQYTTWYNRRFHRTKYSSYDWQSWKESVASDQVITYRPNLTNENLNTVLSSGIYRQPNDANATIANGYPNVKNPAGVLEVTNSNGLYIQEYTTWYNKKFRRTKYSIYDFQPWAEYSAASDLEILEPFKDKKIAWFGDSIVEGNSHPLTIGARLKAASVAKFGFASCMMAKYPGSPNGYDKLSMYRFATAIKTGDFSVPIAGAQWIVDNPTSSIDDNRPQVAEMAATNWNEIDFVVIAFGTNDWRGLTPMGNSYVADSDANTFIGATCHVVESIRSTYPHIKIVFIGPSWRTRDGAINQQYNSDNSTDQQGKYLVDYQDALTNIGKKYRCAVYDFYRDCGINASNFNTYYSDGLHPNSTGVQLWVNKISRFLLSAGLSPSLSVDASYIDNQITMTENVYFNGVLYNVAVLDSRKNMLFGIDDKGKLWGYDSDQLWTNFQATSDFIKSTNVQRIFAETVGEAATATLINDAVVSATSIATGHSYALSKTSKLSKVVTESDLSEASNFDVVIYGSGMPLITAAKTAKENGLSVCLICPDKRVGGMMTAGVSVFDGAASTPSASYGGSVGFLGGNTRKVLNDINTYYTSGGLPVPFTFEPRVAQQVFNRWCAEYADLTILDCKLHDAFTSVVKSGNKLSGVWTSKGLIKGKQFIDASYSGDLLRCAGVSWTSNVEAQSTAEPDGGSRVSMAYAATNVDLESVGLTGADAEDAVKRSQFTIVSGPSDPLIPADGSAIPNTTIGYGTRSIVTKAADRVAFTAYKLASYDRRNHLVFLARIKNTNFDAMTNDQIVRDVIGDQGTIRTVSGEVAFNSNNAKIPQTTRLALDYPSANWQRRLEIEKDAIEHYINHCYFLSTDSAVPAKVRTAMAEWGHSGKEWLDSSYGVGIQFKVYDRQTIRMINDNVVTAYDLRQAENSGHITDKIGIFSYFFDGKKRLAFAYRADATDQKWTLIEESKVTDANTPMYAMSMRMLLPRASECTNLTVAWCCAMTELAFHSCRMEATGGILGEAAATIATLAIQQKLNVQNVTYSDVKQKLITLGVNLGAV